VGRSLTGRKRLQEAAPPGAVFFWTNRAIRLSARAATTALLVAQRNVAAVAYVSGSLGTLIGADLLNLGKIQGLGAPVMSIGGAGTFDGIFLTGIPAVPLASFSPRA
jgi:uncharacterized membrane protein